MQVERRLPLELELDVLVDLTDLEVHALHPGQDLEKERNSVKKASTEVIVPTSAGALKTQLLDH